MSDLDVKNGKWIQHTRENAFTVHACPCAECPLCREAHGRDSADLTALVAACRTLVEGIQGEASAFAESPEAASADTFVRIADLAGSLLLLLARAEGGVRRPSTKETEDEDVLSRAEDAAHPPEAAVPQPPTE